MLQGRHAGKKAVVLNVYEPTADRKYPHAIVLGLEESPKKLLKSMPQEVLVKRTQVKSFIKVVNVNHLLLTRHLVKEDDLLKKIDVEKTISAMKEPAQKKERLTAINAILRQKFLNGRLEWFFKKLAF